MFCWDSDLFWSVRVHRFGYPITRTWGVIRSGSVENSENPVSAALWFLSFLMSFSFLLSYAYIIFYFLNLFFYSFKFYFLSFLVVSVKCFGVLFPCHILVYVLLSRSYRDLYSFLCFIPLYCWFCSFGYVYWICWGFFLCRYFYFLDGSRCFTFISVNIYFLCYYLISAIFYGKMLWIYCFLLSVLISSH